MGFAPLENWRHVKVTAHRTAVDWAQGMQELVEGHFPEAECMVVVLDNLNTHTLAALDAALPPEEAKRLRDKLELHDTPKHGSWLNMAESELSILSRQCLARRLPDQDTLRHETAAWVARRNTAQATIDWQFTSAEARVKLKQLYPVLKPAD
jgi:hypothetical protein